MPQVVAAALGRMQHRLLAGAFTQWHDWAALRSHHSARLALAVQRWQQRVLAAAFCAWVEWAAELTDRRQKLGLACQRWANTTLHSALAAWREHAEGQRQHRTRLVAAVGLWHSAMLRSAWAAWRERVAELQGKRERLRSAVMSWQQAKLRAGWATWQAHLAFRRRAKQVREGGMCETLLLWASCCRAQTWHRPLTSALGRPLLQVLAHFVHSSLSRAFRAWQAAASRRHELSGILEAALLRWQRATLAAAFGAWVDWVEETRAKRERLEVRVLLCGLVSLS